MALTLKVDMGGDVRRFHLELPEGADPQTKWQLILQEVRSGYQLPGDGDGGLTLRYRDDEGDLCTLTPQTLPDCLALAAGGPLRLLAGAPAAAAAAAAGPQREPDPAELLGMIEEAARDPEKSRELLTGLAQDPSRMTSIIQSFLPIFLAGKGKGKGTGKGKGKCGKGKGKWGKGKWSFAPDPNAWDHPAAWEHPEGAWWEPQEECVAEGNFDLCWSCATGSGASAEPKEATAEVDGAESKEGDAEPATVEEEAKDAAAGEASTQSTDPCEAQAPWAQMAMHWRLMMRELKGKGKGKGKGKWGKGKWGEGYHTQPNSTATTATADQPPANAGADAGAAPKDAE